MNLIQWGTTPWGQPVPMHIGWWLASLALVAGLVFLVVHAAWMVRRRKPVSPGPAVPPELAACVPARVPRHSLPARIFHWVMAACMLTLLATAFLPRAGLLFPWVTVHYAAGVILLLAIVFHIINATFFMDFGSVWPNRDDLAGLAGRDRDAVSRRPGKYPLPNKLYHLAIVIVGLTAAITGGFMLFRVRTPFFTRNPYILDDATWGGVYLLHGLAGVTLVALVIVHIYFAARPEERPVTRAMVTGSMDRDFVLAHHDPAKWGCPVKETQ